VSNAPTRPGQLVTATASISEKERDAFKSASSVTTGSASICFRDAISGTTPPYFS